MKEVTATIIRRSILMVGLICAVFTTAVSAEVGKTIGAVYAMTNSAEGNEIVVYNRMKDGLLSYAGHYSTGGLGTGGDAPFEAVDALGSQGPLILSQDQRLLFAVNAISNSISVFKVLNKSNSLELVSITDSEGDFPVSVTMHSNLLYVLNSGGDGNIAGFKIDGEGNLTYITNSFRSLHAGGDNPPFFLVSPAQIQFDPKGEQLAVSVKGSNSIHVFAVSGDGRPSYTSVTNTSNGNTPFGFSFDRKGHLIVAEAFGAGNVGDANASAVSTYKLLDDGSLKTISASVANFQTASCWLATSKRIPFAYTTNNASDTISAYRIDKNGQIKLLNDTGVTAYTGHAPVDLAVTNSGEFLYAVNAGSGTISMFQINPKQGTLNSLGDIDGLPVENGAVGIAVR